MSLTIKIIIITIQILLSIVVTYFAFRSTRYNMITQKYLQNSCTRKTIGICRRFIKDKGKWQAVYQYNTKNGYGEYITAPKPNNTPKPKIGQKITLMVNPKNPNDVYCPNDTFMQTDTTWKKNNAIKFVGTFYLLMIIIGVIIATR